eukprot:TRINITY_DN102307_c0_g1_i1.p1 TRINITY_DN102307_c0_g1~~TRINITY_DN102307_c0_g1_i1.p1  ORF type:complete len:421 (+),score=52.17 TRINITY_DN102307_c0_g1_i1:82-1263(+)
MAWITNIQNQYAELWKAIIRPPRDCYEAKDLGPTVFTIEDRTYQRTDLSLKNPRGFTLVCSHFEPIPTERLAEKLPCVVYLHGNCSSRLEAVSTLPVLLPFNITVFCLDFSGSGLSGGEYLSLGYYERDDLAVVVNYLRETNSVTCIGLWGRSMGASTGLMHADRDPSIAGLVLDSPFSDLRVLCEELVASYTDNKIPAWITSIALSMVRESIRGHAAFDINDLVPIEHVGNAFIPALFAAAYNDTFIRPHHAKELHEAYAGDKNFVMVEGDHNSARSKFFMDSVAIFFFNTLQCDRLPQQRPPSGPSRSLGYPAGQGGRAAARTGGSRGGSRSAEAGLAPMRAPERQAASTVLRQQAPSNEDEEEMVQKAIALSLQENGGTAAASRGMRYGV